MSKRRPIGIFDSGLGGLTVLRALRASLPDESFVYLGDVARLPYGTKSKHVVLEYAKQCVGFLLEKNVKSVIIACNTASALALDEVAQSSPVPVVGVVRAGVQTVLDLPVCKRVWVLATESTVRSEAYLREMARVAPQVKVNQISCPLLVPLAEQGWWDDPITEQVIRRYLDGVGWEQGDAVVLGCTHFPLLEPSLRKVVPSGVPLVHGASRLADELREFLDVPGPQASYLDRVESGASFFLTDKVHTNLPILGDYAAAMSLAEVVQLVPWEPGP